MTRKRNARVAGFFFLFYIATGLTAMFLSGRATRGEGAAAKLASLAQHAMQYRVSVLLVLFGCISALVLAVTLYSITRDEDPDLALMVLVFRGAEGVVGAVSLPRMLGKVWLATDAGADAPGPAARDALSASLITLPTWTGELSATFFAIGSLFFCYLLLRGRMVPVALAWLGLVASILLVVLLPLDLAGFLSGPITFVMWLPMLLFEVPLALWLLIKGVRGAS